MNWTGGRLHRHSHNKRGMLERIQKQHFAKARIKRQHARPETPQHILLLNKSRIDENGGGGGSDRRGSMSVKDQKMSKER